MKSLIKVIICAKVRNKLHMTFFYDRSTSFRHLLIALIELLYFSTLWFKCLYNHRL